MSAKYKVTPLVLPGALVNARDMLARERGTVCLFQDCDSKKRDNTISRDAVVDAIRSRRNQAGDPLHGGLVFDTPVRLQTSGTLYKAVAAKVVTIWLYVVALMDILFLGNSEEQCVSGGLVPHSQMITPNEALPACADNIISKVVSQLYGLIDPTATIAQICCLRRPEVCTKALYIEAESIRVMQKAAIREDPL